jgi:hypothetical protein
LSDHAGVGRGDFILREFDRNNFFDLVFQAKSDFCDFASGIGWGRKIIVITGEYYSMSVETSRI